MTLIPLDSILLTDKERYDSLVFKKRKLENQITQERHKYMRDQYISQLKEINRQIVDIKPKVKKQNMQTEADRITLEKCFMWEAKKFLIKPHYDFIFNKALARMKIEKEKNGPT